MCDRLTDEAATTTTATTIECLPVELLALVFELLPCIDRRIGPSGVCRLWRKMARERSCVAALVAPRNRFHRAAVVAKAAVEAAHFECIRRTLKERLATSACRSRDIARAAGRAGNVDNLVAVEAKGHRWPHLVVIEAAAHNRTDMVRHMFEVSYPEIVRRCAVAQVLAAAIAGGHVDCVAAIVPYDWQRLVHTCRLAARAGRLAILRVLVSAGYPHDKRTCSSAAASGRVDVLRYLHEDVGCAWDADTCREASQLDVLAYAHENGCPWDASICWVAIYSMRWTRSRTRRSSWRRETATTAQDQNHGRIACFTYARAHGCAVDEKPCISAACMGDLDLLKTLHGLGCPLSARVLMIAATEGLNALVVYALEHGCPRDESVCVNAAARGAYNILRHALAHGCPYGTEAIEAAQRGGHHRCATLLKEKAAALAVDQTIA